jgi:hypothetical protein
MLAAAGECDQADHSCYRSGPLVNAISETSGRSSAWPDRRSRFALQSRRSRIREVAARVARLRLEEDAPGYQEESRKRLVVHGPSPIAEPRPKEACSPCAIRHQEGSFVRMDKFSGYFNGLVISLRRTPTREIDDTCVASRVSLDTVTIHERRTPDGPRP